MSVKSKGSRRAWRDPDAAPEITGQWISEATISRGKKLVRRGRPAGSGQKTQTTLRISNEVLQYFRATGPGWQTRMDDALKRYTPIKGSSEMPDNEMPARTCVICDEAISIDNDSKEHVMTEAIGGRLTVKGFICRRCNNDAGRTWDAQLANQLHPLSLMFGVQRQRGATPGLQIRTTAGEELVITADGPFTLAKPSFTEEKVPEGVKVQIVARSMEEAKGMLAGVKRKYPSVDVEQILANAQMSTSYPEGLVHHSLDFGGEISGRSIVKSVLAMAYHAGVPTRACHDALDYLRNPSAIPCFGYYQETDLVVGRPDEVPLNCVSIQANPETGLVLGYAEYFGVHRVVARLGRRYAGPEVRACYAVDPRTGDKLDLTVSLDFDEADIQDIFDYKRIPDGGIQEAFAKVMPAAIKRKFEAERERVTRAAAEYAFANCGAKPGEMLTEEHVKRLSTLMVEKLGPYIFHLVRSRRRNVAAEAIPRACPDEHSRKA